MIPWPLGLQSMVVPACLAGLLAGCDPGTGIVCTSQFVAAVVVLVDSTGRPVGDAMVSSTLPRTGEALAVAYPGQPDSGTYVIVDDGNRDQLLPSGDSVGVLAQHGPASLTADYVFDVPLGCHVHKVSGPDTLTVP